MSHEAEIDEDLIAGQKIAAIKRYREDTGASLVQSKAVIDARESELKASGRIPVIAKRLFRMNLWVIAVLFLFVAVVLGVVMIALLRIGSALG